MYCACVIPWSWDVCDCPCYHSWHGGAHCLMVPAGCAPGYYNNSTSSDATAAACTLCPKGSWCPGGSAAAAARNSCGAFLTSVSTGAVSPASCITQPGAAYMSGAGTAHACKPGYYNAGGNRRNCTACPVGMSTTAAGASSSGACTAKPGWFYQVRQCLRVRQASRASRYDVVCMLCLLIQHNAANTLHGTALHVSANALVQASSTSEAAGQHTVLGQLELDGFAQLL